MPGLGVYYQASQEDNKKPMETPCQILNVQLFDNLRGLSMANLRGEKECVELSLQYLRTLHKVAIICPDSPAPELDSHHATNLASQGLYQKTYFSSDDLTKDESEDVCNAVLKQAPYDIEHLNEQLTWGQWLSRVFTQKPRKM